MSKKMYVLFAVLLMASMLLAACQPAAPAAPAEEEMTYKICQVTDTGGIDDKSFNATAWKGVQDAIACWSPR